MATRLIRWFLYNVTFALIPVMAGILLRGLSGKNLIDIISTTPEILFFSIMLCSTALGDLSDTSKRTDKDLFIKIFTGILLLGAIVSSILYGSLLLFEIQNVRNAGFRTNLLSVSFILGVLLLIFTTSVEYIIAKIEN